MLQRIWKVTVYKDDFIKTIDIVLKFRRGCKHTKPNNALPPSRLPLSVASVSLYHLRFAERRNFSLRATGEITLDDPHGNLDGRLKQSAHTVSRWIRTYFWGYEDAHVITVRSKADKEALSEGETYEHFQPQFTYPVRIPSLLTLCFLPVFLMP